MKLSILRKTFESWKAKIIVVSFDLGVFLRSAHLFGPSVRISMFGASARDDAAVQLDRRCQLITPRRDYGVR